MTGKTIGAWIRRALGGQGTDPQRGADGADARLGKPVLTNEGQALGTVVAVWPAAAGTDGAPHEETLGVHPTEQEEANMVYVPAKAIARVSDKGVVLTVDGTQVTARGWRYRPEWLPHDDPQEVPPGTTP